jgi:aminomethyltransferase
MPKKLPLHSAHLRASARFVDFHGWEMPVNYGSQLEEHLQVRRHAGVFDVSHMTVVDLKGEQVVEFLQYLLANDVMKLKDHHALYSCMLNEEGGVVDDLIAYRLSGDYFRLVVNSATAEKDLAWMTRCAQLFAVTMTHLPDLCILAVQGPKAVALLADALDATQWVDLKPFSCTWISDTIFCARTGYTGEEGCELIVPAALAADLWDRLMQAGVQPCGLASRDTLRLEAGLNLYGNDMDETTHPFQSHLAWTVALTPPTRDFVGRGALEAIKARGVNDRLVGLILEGKGVLRAGLAVEVEGVGVGVITSGGFSPTLNQSIAMARIPKVPGPTFVDMRGKRKPVVVVSLPFVRKGQVVYKAEKQEKTSSE